MSVSMSSSEHQQSLRGVVTTYDTQIGRRNSGSATVIGPFSVTTRSPTAVNPADSEKTHRDHVASQLHMFAHSCPLCAVMSKSYGSWLEYDQNVTSVHPLLPHIPVQHHVMSTGNHSSQKHHMEAYHVYNNTASQQQGIEAVAQTDQAQICDSHKDNIDAALTAVKSFIHRGYELATYCSKYGDSVGEDRLVHLCRQAEALRLKVEVLSRGDTASTPSDLYAAARELRDAMLRLQECICEDTIERLVAFYSDIDYWYQRICNAAFLEWAASFADLIILGHNGNLYSPPNVAAALNSCAEKLKLLSQRTHPSTADAENSLKAIQQLMPEAIGYTEMIHEAESLFLRRSADAERRLIIDCDTKAATGEMSRAERLSRESAVRVARQAAATLLGDPQDEQDRRRVATAADTVERAIDQMCRDAQAIQSNVSDRSAFERWTKSCDVVAKALSILKDLITRIEEHGGSGQHGSLARVKSRSSATPSPALIPPPPPPAPVPVPARPPSTPTVSHSESHFDVSRGEHRIMAAAKSLHEATSGFSTCENELIAEAKHMARLMAQLSQLIKSTAVLDGHSLIGCTAAVAETAERIEKLSLHIAQHCRDNRIKTALGDSASTVKTVGSQLKMLCVIKSAILELHSHADHKESLEQLVDCAHLLMRSVRDVVHWSEAATVKMRSHGGTLKAATSTANIAHD